MILMHKSDILEKAVALIREEAETGWTTDGSDRDGDLRWGLLCEVYGIARLAEKLIEEENN